MSEQDDAKRIADFMNTSDSKRLADAMRLAGTRSPDDAIKLVADFRKDDAKKLDAIKDSPAGKGIDAAYYTPYCLLRARWENRFPSRKLTHAALIAWLNVEHGKLSFASDNLTITEVAALLKGPEPVVKLQGEHNPVIVSGVEQEALTSKQYRVIAALIDAGQDGLRLNDLNRKSRCGDGRGILDRIKELSPEWERAVVKAGQSGRCYRIRHTANPHGPADIHTQ
ncbi:MAG: hypothetical protein ABGZ35_15060 [Planctomycetaceae bacterium]